MTMLWAILWSWCKVCMVRTEHISTEHGLVCLCCHPERDPRKGKA